MFDELGPRAVKGIDAPIAVYRVREASGARSRFEATAMRGLTPLVGRDEELSLLLSRWASAKEGEGQVVLLTGEPGIGKSRIIQAFREQVRDDGATVLHYFCSPFYVHSALHPILDQLERAAAAEEERPARGQAGQARGAAQPGHQPRSPAPPPCSRRCCRFPPASAIPQLDLAPERKKTLALEALLEQLAGLAARPVLIILEDAHWIDPDLRRAVPADHRSHPAHAGRWC